MDDKKRGSRKLPLVIGLPVLAILAWWGANSYFGGSGLAREELLALKNSGLASVENIPNKLRNDGTESMKLFTQLVKAAPDVMLGIRNLAIAGILAVEKQHANRDESPEKYALTLKLAREALVELREKDPDSGIVDILEAKLHVTLEEEAEAAKLFRAAYDKHPDDSIALMELFVLLRNGQGEERDEVVRQAATVNANNLIVLEQIVRLQAESEDKAIVSTLNNAIEVLAPYKAILAQQKIEVATELPQFVQAIEAGDDAVWNKVKIRMIQVFNVVKQDFGYHTDMVQLQRHPLEYLIHEFPKGYFDASDLPDVGSGGIEVSFLERDSFATLHELEGVLDAIICDFNLDRQLDLIVLQSGKLSVFELDDQADQWSSTHSVEIAADLQHVIAVDLDRDATTTTPEAYSVSDFDFLLYGAGGVQVVENVLPKDTQQRSLMVSDKAFANADISDVAFVSIADIENDGDLDLVLACKGGLQLWKNHENWLFSDVTSNALPEAAKSLNTQVLATADFNRSLQQDIYVSGGVFENIRHGRLRFNEASTDLLPDERLSSLAVFDVDNNGTADLVFGVGQGLSGALTGNTPGGKVWKQGEFQVTSDSPRGMRPIDFDNDGWRDLVAWSDEGLQFYRNNGNAGLEIAEVDVPVLQNVSKVDVDDLDEDGDLDLLVVANEKLVVLDNEGGNVNHWIKVRLCAEPDPMFKVQRSNVHGVGARVDLRSASGFQSQQGDGRVVHFGVGKSEGAEAVRVLWTNGIPQNILSPKPRLTFTEKQELLKGSCPYLYTWTGEKYEFFTDLLWAAPIGLQFGEGVIAPTRDWEYLLIPGDRLVPVDGQYRMQITEELWEAAYFDQVQLIALDHPEGTVVFSNEKVGPPSVSQYQVHSFRQEALRPVARAVGSNGDDLGEVLREQDGVFTKLFDRRHKQGLVEEYYVELELGDLAGAESVHLVMTGWMFPTDTSINIALSQNSELQGPRPPYLSMPRADAVTGETWEEVVPNMGFPGGKTKTIVVKIPVDEFENDDFRLRMSTSMELYWDQILVAVDAEAALPVFQNANLSKADLHYRGFSARLPRLNNGPERYDYDQVKTEVLWPPMAGSFTRFGETTDLLTQQDNQLVVLGGGDEMTVLFDELPPVREGWTRDFLIHSIGWDKDADLNTITGYQVEPLPFVGMQQYPPVDDRTVEAVDTPEYRHYLEQYQTREFDRGNFWNLMRN